MTAKQFYNQYIRPYLTDENGQIDKPKNRQMYNDVKDCLHRDGQITDKQLNNWVYPGNKYFK